MNTYYVYILKCSDGSYYTGITNDLERRVWEHDNGEILNCYTHNRRPLILEYFEKYCDVTNAIAREKQIKRWSRIKKESLINDNIEQLKLVSKNYTQYGRTSMSGDD